MIIVPHLWTRESCESGLVSKLQPAEMVIINLIGTWPVERVDCWQKGRSRGQRLAGSVGPSQKEESMKKGSRVSIMIAEMYCLLFARYDANCTSYQLAHLNLTTSLRGRICFSIFQMRKWKTICIKPKESGSRVQAPAIIPHPPTMEYIHMYVCIYYTCIYNVHAYIMYMHISCTCTDNIHAYLILMYHQ